MTNEAQRRIDDEITRLVSLLYDLRFQRNTFSSTFHLPPEVLAEIFVQGARDHHEKKFRERGVPGWVNVSYVCRQWRDVALDCPTLWSYHFLESRQWTEALLARSKQAPLNISGRVGYSDWSHPFLEKVADHAERIQELRLCLGSSDADRCFKPFLRPGLRAPRLQVLVIDADAFCGIAMEEALFNGETPSLRKLDLTNITMSSSFRPSNLNFLSVQHFYHRRRMVEFLSTLGCMRDLVDLHLHDALRSSRSLSNADFNAFQGIDLPHLSRLWIRSSLSTVVAFLSRLNTPPKTEVRLHCENDNSSPDDYSQLSLLLAQKLRSSEDETSSVPRVRTFGVKFGSYTTTFVFSASERDFNRSIDENNTSWGCNIPLQLSIESRTTSAQLFDNISSYICCNGCPKDVQSLYVCGLDLSSRFWASALKHFQDLRYLKATYVPARLGSGDSTLSRHSR